MYFVAHYIMGRTTSETWLGDEISQLWSGSENLDEVRRVDSLLQATMLTCLADRYVDGLLAWSYDLDKQNFDPCIFKRKGISSFHTLCHVTLQLVSYHRIGYRYSNIVP